MKTYILTAIAMLMFFTTNEAMLRETPKLIYRTAGGESITSSLRDVNEETFRTMSPASYEYVSSMFQSFQTYLAKTSSAHITEKEQFLQISGMQAGKIKEFTFEGFLLDQDFFLHYCKVMTGEFDKIRFVGCSTSADITFSDILDSSNVRDLDIVSCSITSEDLSEVLLRINPHAIKRLDISGNSFIESTAFADMLIGRIHGIMCLDELKLTGNGFSQTFINGILDRLKD